MAKQLTRLKSFFGIATGLLSLSYFIDATFAINLKPMSEVDLKNDDVSGKLPKTANIYRSISSIAINLHLKRNETEQNTIPYDHNSEKLDSFEIALPEIRSRQMSEYLALMLQKPKASKEDFNSIEIDDLLHKKQEFSLGNFVAYLVNSFQQIRTDRPIKIEKSTDITILPQVKGDELFKDMYDFDINIQKKEYDLNSPLSSVFNDQSTNNNSPANSNQNLLGSKLSPSTTNSNPYVGLQNQLVASLDDYQTRNQDRVLARVEGNTGFRGRAIASRGNNQSSQYFEKAQQYSNPAGLIHTSPNF
jgi:hypothetical protein